MFVILIKNWGIKYAFYIGLERVLCVIYTYTRKYKTNTAEVIFIAML